ncbi:MAG TPA: RES family NAD+ phosphorylase [Puia sp.]|nr:RES family NAD+ phosphorylase [Puia sp.]
MIVFRITLEKYADRLSASGNAARWNSRDIKVIYTAGSRALACLENVVHRSSRGLQGNFRIIQAEIPDNLKITVITKTSLIPDWQNFANMPYTQASGDKWVKEASSAILRVPSVIIPDEFNYILNPAHPDFSRISYLGNEPFTFDGRLKE